jgi:hypothetical protein
MGDGLASERRSRKSLKSFSVFGRKENEEKARGDDSKRKRRFQTPL